MNLSPIEWKQEEQRVKEVVHSVERRINTMNKHLSDTKEDIVEIRKSFWDDVRVNVDEPDEFNETFSTIKQQAEFLSERERSHGHGNYQLSKLLKLKNSPYFGRINFLFEEEDQTESIYLGIATFLDENDQFLIYDWRAPISSLYYDSLPGPASYETSTGRINGELTLKRQYIIKNGTIKGMFDTGVAIGDELLQEVLGMQSDAHMKTIVSTIQKEQNQIIRNEASKLLVVQGAAGSGKTSAALQRVAYLLYRYRETLHAEHIVLFSPNQLFNHYVASVLPELGEQNMKQTTYHDFLLRIVGEHIEVEDPFAQLEYTLNPSNESGYKARLQAIKLKSSEMFLDVLRHYVTILSGDGLVFNDIKLKGRTILSSEYIKNVFYNYDQTISLSNRLQLLTEHLLKELKRIAKKETKEPWVEEEIQYLDKESYLKAYENLQRKNKKQFSEEVFNDFELEQKLLSKLVVKSYFNPIVKKVKGLQYVDIMAIYRGVFTEPTCVEQIKVKVSHDQWNAICQLTIQTIERGSLYYEDATPYLYLKERIEGIHKNTSVRHIFLDEAQDYTVIQLEVLNLLFPNSRFTLLGDLNQAIFAHSTNASPFESFTLNSKGQKEIIKLTKSYRSTRPIVEFTRELVTGGNQIEPFNRSGEKPILIESSDEVLLHKSILNQISNLSHSGYQNIAVVCKTYAESLQAYEQLKDHTKIKLMKKEASLFEPGLVVIPSYLAKGIEFDAVIIYNASSLIYGQESERKLFYTACTRAMHRLYVNYLGEKTSFLSVVNSSLYIKQ